MLVSAGIVPPKLVSGVGVFTLVSVWNPASIHVARLPSRTLTSVTPAHFNAQNTRYAASWFSAE